MDTAADGSVMLNERKTVRIRIRPGYVPAVSEAKKAYWTRVFAAFWSLAK